MHLAMPKCEQFYLSVYCLFVCMIKCLFCHILYVHASKSAMNSFDYECWNVVLIMLPDRPVNMFLNNENGD
jgi:SET domain-containing protein